MRKDLGQIVSLVDSIIGDCSLKSFREWNLTEAAEEMTEIFDDRHGHEPVFPLRWERRGR